MELNLQPGVKYVISMPVLPLSSAGSTTASGALPPEQQKMFTCDVCDFEARDNCNLTQHKKSMHTRKVPALVCPRFIFDICSSLKAFMLLIF